MRGSVQCPLRSECGQIADVPICPLCATTGHGVGLLLQGYPLTPTKAGDTIGDASILIREISHENFTSECRSSAVVGLGNGTKRQRSGGPRMDETDTS